MINMDELERLALIAQESPDSQGGIEFLKISTNPNTILELIETNRNLAHSMDLAEAGLKWYYEEYMRNMDGYDTVGMTGILKSTPGLTRTSPDEDTVKIRSILANTGHTEADFLIEHIMSTPQDLLDTASIVSFIRRLILEEIKGPDGHNTWKDAAVAERMKNLKSITRANGESNE